MPVAEGTFVLYSRIEPPLEAGDYRLTARQELAASGPSGELDPSELPVAELPTHFRVRAPRFVLPPDQVLSTFPPANSEGAYGTRLPQVVIKRRTLPWERLLSPGRRGTPWLALVVVAEGEAELRLNQPVAECVTPGVTLAGPADSAVGNCLVVRRSVVDRVFPTRLDVPLLAHAREVDIHDTELMMGDDDGFLAVVIANRLPLPARDAAGQEVPVKYLACLVSLEGAGQFDVLLERAPPAQLFTAFPVYQEAVALNVAALDHVAMHTGGTAFTAAPNTAGDGVRALDTAGGAVPVTGVASGAAAFQQASQYRAAGAFARADADVYAEMARPFGRAGVGPVFQALDPVYRFPVLLHWSFTSTGNTTFRALMEELDSGLLGTVDGRLTDGPPAGRPPLEVVETGHVGLAHRTRRGDSGRTWYRGPCVPHPTADPPGGRLPLAHAADQLRIVVPDGREDLSLASAFEIGRLLALARPSMVAALLRWRQVAYQTARRRAVWETQLELVAGLLPGLTATRVGANVGVLLGRALAGAVAARPASFLGDPQPLVSAGRPLALDRPANQVLAAGFALDVGTFRGAPAEVLDRIRKTPVVTAPRVPLSDSVLTGAAGRLTRETLLGRLDAQLDRLGLDTLAPTLNVSPAGPPVVTPRGRRGRPKPPPPPDALDQLIAALAAGAAAGAAAGDTLDNSPSATNGSTPDSGFDSASDSAGPPNYDSDPFSGGHA